MLRLARRGRTRHPFPQMRTCSLAAVCGCILAIAGCGSGGDSQPSGPSQRAALARYLHQIEPVRLSVNRLLEGADPILGAFRQHKLTHAAAAQRMGVLERRFADYAIQIAAIRPATAQLRALHNLYAHTYVLEDSYLNALVAGLHSDKLDNLPNTQNDQRAAIIQWRFGLTVLAHRVGLRLPADLQQAGRGEVAPSIGAS
jgi:hypothetical protein